MEYTTKVIKSLENRDILLKESSEKVINQKGGFHNPLMRVGLTLMKNVLASLAKSVLISLGLTALASATDAAIFWKNLWIRDGYTNNLKQRNER